MRPRSCPRVRRKGTSWLLTEASRPRGPSAFSMPAICESRLDRASSPEVVVSSTRLRGVAPGPEGRSASGAEGAGAGREERQGGPAPGGGGGELRGGGRGGWGDGGGRRRRGA